MSTKGKNIKTRLKVKTTDVVIVFSEGETKLHFPTSIDADNMPYHAEIGWEVFQMLTEGGLPKELVNFEVQKPLEGFMQ